MGLHPLLPGSRLSLNRLEFNGVCHLNTYTETVGMPLDIFFIITTNLTIYYRFLLIVQIFVFL